MYNNHYQNRQNQDYQDKQTYVLVDKEKMKETLLLSQVLDHNQRIVELFVKIDNTIRLGREQLKYEGNKNYWWIWSQIIGFFIQQKSHKEDTKQLQLEDDFDNLALFLNISRNLYKPSNYPQNSFKRVMYKPQQDIERISEQCLTPELKQYIQLYKQVVTTGQLDYEVPLPSGTKEPITCDNLENFTKNLVNGMIIENFREEYYEKNPNASADSFSQIFYGQNQQNQHGQEIHFHQQPNFL